VIEDTALDINDLPQFTEELSAKKAELGTRLISYAHIATVNYISIRFWIYNQKKESGNIVKYW